jgi:hypothetical protein
MNSSEILLAFELYSKQTSESLTDITVDYCILHIRLHEAFRMIPGPEVPPFVFGWQYYNNVVTPLYLLHPHNQPAVAISGLPLFLTMR